MLLAELVEKSAIGIDAILSLPLLRIAGISSDSRLVGPNFLFIALPGFQKDGAHFIDDALAKGACVIVASPDVIRAYLDVKDIDEEKILNRLALGDTLADLDPPFFIESSNPRLILAKMAAVFYPLQPDHVVAVTGTNGKSSTVSFCRQLWSALDLKGCSLGTLGLEAPDFESVPQPSFGLTTPDSVVLHRYLDQLTALGVTHLALEASSHGLDQMRLSGVRLSAAAFTNLSQDHLDYHKTMEHYFNAKKKLFGDLLSENKTVVLNADVGEFGELVAIAKSRNQKIISYGYQASELKLKEIQPTSLGQKISVEIMGQPYDVLVPIIGEFQIYNLLCAFGLVLATLPRFDRALIKKMVDAFKTIQGVHGRLQFVRALDNGAAVYIDYAHTPDALEVILKAMRPHVKGSLWLIFGCGGERDQSKRAIMGAIAQKLADHVVVTDDNPRNEDPALIRSEILKECKKATEVPGREQAISFALDRLQPGDVLVVAGKGHERVQVIGQTVYPFDDGEVVCRLSSKTKVVI